MKLTFSPRKHSILQCKLVSRNIFIWESEILLFPHCAKPTSLFFLWWWQRMLLLLLFSEVKLLCYCDLFLIYSVEMSINFYYPKFTSRVTVPCENYWILLSRLNSFDRFDQNSVKSNFSNVNRFNEIFLVIVRSNLLISDFT